MEQGYTAPEIRELGSLTDVTQQLFNKVGTESDLLSQLTNGIVVGSFTAVP